MSDAEWEAIRLTLLVALTAVAFSLPLAMVTGWVLAKWQFPGKFLLETAVHLPLVLPPVVTGYLLLVTLGRQSFIGSLLESQLGMRMVFDWKGAAIASAVVGFPLLVRPIRLAFASVDPRLIEAARTLGASPRDVFLSITLPLSRPGILSGCVLAFARSMGEFGATMMIAGSIPGQTRTVPLMIYAMLDTPGGQATAERLVVASVIIAAAAMLASELLQRYAARQAEGSHG